MRSKSKTLVIIAACLGLLFIVGVIVYFTVVNGKTFSSFRASIPLKSDLKRASEIDYEEYVGDDELDLENIHTVEWVIHHWYEGFEPVTVFYEDIDYPSVEDEYEMYDTQKRVIIDYARSLLESEDITPFSINVIDETTGCYRFKKGDREYLICLIITDETEEGKVTVFHSEVIHNEAE